MGNVGCDFIYVLILTDSHGNHNVWQFTELKCYINDDQF